MAIVGHFVEVCKKRGIKVNASKNKVIVLNGEQGLECEVSVDEMQLEHVSEFKYLGFVLNESGTDEAVSQEGGKWEEGCRCYWSMIGIEA